IFASLRRDRPPARDGLSGELPMLSRLLLGVSPLAVLVATWFAIPRNQPEGLPLDQVKEVRVVADEEGVDIDEVGETASAGARQETIDPDAFANAINKPVPPDRIAPAGGQADADPLAFQKKKGGGRRSSGGSKSSKQRSKSKGRGGKAK